jgi:hypothetical protein
VLAAITELKEWSDFYVIVGAAAGALTSIMFVVIALRRDGEGPSKINAVETYSTPTVVHFATVVFIAALLTVPKHSELSLALCLAASGASGLGYGGWIFIQSRRMTAYTEYLSDWIWRHILPGGSYLALIVAAAVVWVSTDLTLDLIAASSLVLLLSGIHNAWDTAVWISTDHSDLQG